MIFHQAVLAPAANGTVEWWAVDANSLTLASCRVETGPKIFIEIVRPMRETVAVTSHPLDYDFKKSAVHILTDCRQRFKHLKTCPAAFSEAAEEDEDIPEYILMSDPLGIPEAIFHSRDPHFIALFSLARPFPDPWKHLISYHSTVPLPEAGWEYWCTDARQEFDRLSVDYFTAARSLASSR